MLFFCFPNCHFFGHSVVNTVFIRRFFERVFFFSLYFFRGYVQLHGGGEEMVTCNGAILDICTFIDGEPGNNQSCWQIKEK